MPFNIDGYIYNGGIADTQDYKSIINRGLVFSLDSGTPESYPGSGNSWYDMSGNNYHGTLTNGPIYSTDNQGLIVFDGSNDYITTADVNHGTSEFTLETWVYLSSLNTNKTIIKKNTDNDYWPVFSMVVETDGTFRGYYSSQIYGQCLEGALTSPGNIAINNWYHLCFSKGAGGYTTMKLHKNGVSQSYSFYLYGSHINNVCDSSKPVLIGIDYDYPNFINPVNGKIPIVRIYNRQLSDAEVLHNYNIQKDRFGL
jgi:hypothetical protein